MYREITSERHGGFDSHDGHGYEELWRRVWKVVVPPFYMEMLKDAWGYGQNLLSMQDIPESNFVIWFQVHHQKWDDKQLGVFIIVGYKIWQRQNEHRLGKQTIPLSRIFPCSLEAWEEFNGLAKAAFTHATSVRQRWRKPGIAWACSVSHASSVELLEAMAIREGLLLLKAWGYKSVIVEGDCQGVMKALKEKKPYLSSTGILLDEIQVIGMQLESVSVEWVSGDANQVALLLASTGRTLSSLCWEDV
ncbi:hypothetical protein L6164_012380 [Bauhinia variegata]|uniref:Uncharacterized protein n=1 Tax=Bauhinia variegata TaxID=167791 RepID=A0ACB9P9X6_BAUVA|nr:hypothetical protein L6164_012380 [Bauhinia variegata]